MSFRKYGGLDRAATNNIVRSNYATGNNESITVALGQENSKIICKSHLDLSGNSLINVGSIYFMEEAHLYGNLIMDGTVTILETTTLYGPLIVNNTSYFAGASTFNSNVTINGPLVVNNTSYFAGNSTFNSNVTINGALNLDGGILTSSATTFQFLPYSSTTINYGGANTINNIIGDEQSTAPDNGALVVIGGVGIGKNLNVGGDTLIGGSLGVSGPLGVTGSVHFYDTLTVEGDATFNSGVGISGPLGVTGPTTLYNTLTVGGIAIFNSSVGISGPLGVTGPTTLYNTLTVDGDAIFNSSVGISGPLGVTGPTTLYNSLTVGGDATFNSSVGISGPLGVTGPTTLYNTLTVGGTAIFNGPVGINGDLGITGALNVGGTATFGNSIVLSGPTGNIIMNGPTGNYIQFPDQTKQYTASSPIGSITMYGGLTTPPTGYLFCDGSSYSTANYQELFNVIQYNYGGSAGTFTVPNLQQRFPVGTQNQSQMSITVNSSPSGVIGGSEYLIASDIPTLPVISVTASGSITATVTTTGNAGYFSAGPSFNNSVQIPSAGAADTVLKTDSNGYSPTVTINNSLSYSGVYTNSSQTQTYPKFTVVNYIIKY